MDKSLSFFIALRYPEALARARAIVKDFPAALRRIGLEKSGTPSQAGANTTSRRPSTICVVGSAWSPAASARRPPR